MNHAKYSLITIRPNFERLDVVVCGVAAHAGENWHILFSDEPEKILAVNPNFEFRLFSEFKVRLKELAEGCDGLDQLRLVVKLIGSALQVDQFIGRFNWASSAEIVDQLHRIMSESVDPPERTKSLEKKNHSLLRSRLKQQFLSLGLLGKTVSDINDHKVVSRYPIEASQGLFADFALKNSVMHITATLDFTTSEQAYTAKKYETQAKCLVLKAAEEICGPKTKKYVIVAGADKKNSNSALNLLRANAKVYDFEDTSNMAEYLEAIQRAALGRSPLH